jgi:hypothetical protein
MILLVTAEAALAVSGDELILNRMLVFLALIFQSVGCSSPHRLKAFAPTIVVPGTVPLVGSAGTAARPPW